VSSSQLTVTDSVRPVVLNFVSVNDGRVYMLNATQLLPCSGFLTGEITIPNELFQYVLEGYDHEGHKFSQTSLTTPFTFPDPSPSSVVPTSTSSPTPSPSPDFPFLNGGRCVTVIHFGHRRVFYHCPDGYTGSTCQSSKFIHYIS